MDRLRTRGLENIEQKMRALDEDSLRYRILNSVKGFKTSWVELGQALYSVWKDKLYKEWGYQNFDNYSARELGIRKQTAMKLLRSYYFLEKEEPSYLKDGYLENAQANTVPGYEAIDALRMAKNKKILDEQDYANIKKDVFEKGKDVREIKRDLTSLMRQREELDPYEAREKRKIANIKRAVSLLRNLKRDLSEAKLVPAAVLKEIDELVRKLDREMQIIREEE